MTTIYHDRIMVECFANNNNNLGNIHFCPLSFSRKEKNTHRKSKLLHRFIQTQVFFFFLNPKKCSCFFFSLEISRQNDRLFNQIYTVFLNRYFFHSSFALHLTEKLTNNKHNGCIYSCHILNHLYIYRILKKKLNRL